MTTAVAFHFWFSLVPVSPLESGITNTGSSKLVALLCEIY
jgi:hypothetical protein